MSRSESCRSICSATTDAIGVGSLVGSFPAWPRRHTCAPPDQPEPAWQGRADGHDDGDPLDSAPPPPHHVDRRTRRPGEARSQVRSAIEAWDVPADPAVAALLTSELVTNAISHQAGETIMLVLTCTWSKLRVDVHDTSWAMPELLDAPADAESGRGLMLVASLATDWGYYPTLAGKAVYFTLAL